MINSTYFVEPEFFDGKDLKLPSFSMGWVTGVRKGGHQTEDESDEVNRLRSIIKTINEMSEPMKSRALETFWFYNKKTLLRSHLPLGGENSGGFDLPVYSEVHNLQFMKYCHKNNFSFRTIIGHRTAEFWAASVYSAYELTDEPKFKQLKNLYRRFVKDTKHHEKKTALCSKCNCFNFDSQTYSYKHKRTNETIKLTEGKQQIRYENYLPSCNCMGSMDYFSLRRGWIEKESRWERNLLSPEFALREQAYNVNIFESFDLEILNYNLF
jgi:hypothetical protein